MGLAVTTYRSTASAGLPTPRGLPQYKSPAPRIRAILEAGIRGLIRGDATAIFDFQVQSILAARTNPNYKDGFPLPNLKTTSHWVDEQFQKSPEMRDPVSLAVISDTVIGMAKVTKDQKGSGELEMAVRDTYWNRGIGTTLLDDVINISRSSGLNSITLFVYRCNAGARRLYPRFGFEYTGQSERMYRAGAWDITDQMVLNLHPSEPIYI